MSSAAEHILRILTAIPSTTLLGAAPFLVLFAAIILSSSIVSSLAGFGGGVLALPFVVWVCGDLWLAVIVLLLLGTVQCGLMAILNIRHVQWRRLGALAGWSALGIPAGLLLATRLPRQPVMIAMGLVILAGGVAGFSTVRSGAQGQPLRLVDRANLIAAGIMHGAFGCGGPTVVLAARHVLPTKEAFRGTLFVFWVLLNGLALIGLAPHASAAGLPLLLLVGLPSMMLGSWSGERVSRRITQQRFARIVASLLILTGLITILRVAT